MEYLNVKNWDEFQQYKDREPKWIKIYRSILMDYKYEQLNDAEFGALVKIWLLSSQLNNKIPYDPSFIQRKCGLSSKPNIKKYLQLGFLILDESVQDCTEMYKNVPREDKIREEREKSTVQKRFTPPSQDDVILYFQENGYTKSSAIHAYKYYNEGDWKDSRGNQVKNWKQKMRGVWFKDENKMPREVKTDYKTWETPDWMKDLPSIGKKI